MPESKEMICYCFGYTLEDLKKDYKRYGYSNILKNILWAKKRGGCDCAHTNPKGR